jgi:hypothetical protein
MLVRGAHSNDKRALARLQECAGYRSDIGVCDVEVFCEHDVAHGPVDFVHGFPKFLCRSDLDGLDDGGVCGDGGRGNFYHRLVYCVAGGCWGRGRVVGCFGGGGDELRRGWTRLEGGG